MLRATNKQTAKVHYILSPQVNCSIKKFNKKVKIPRHQGQRFNSVKEALGSGQWPKAKKKLKKGKVIPDQGKVAPDQGKEVPEKGKVISEKGKKLASSKFAPKTKFMRAKDLLRGLLRKNHAAKKDSRNIDSKKIESDKEELQAGSEVISWTVKCDDCGYKAENITSLTAHKKANHVLKEEE